MSKLESERAARDKAHSKIIGLFQDFTDRELGMLFRQVPQWYEAEVEEILKELVEEINENNI